MWYQELDIHTHICIYIYVYIRLSIRLSTLTSVANDLLYDALRLDNELSALVATCSSRSVSEVQINHSGLQNPFITSKIPWRISLVMPIQLTIQRRSCYKYSRWLTYLGLTNAICHKGNTGTQGKMIWSPTWHPRILEIIGLTRNEEKLKHAFCVYMSKRAWWLLCCCCFFFFVFFFLIPTHENAFFILKRVLSLRWFPTTWSPL